MDFLSEFPLAPNSRVLELGCGYGLAGIYCAKHFGAQVTALDADPAVLPYAAFHADLNEVELDLVEGRYEQISTGDFEDFDLVIGADICFWDEMSSPLYNLVRRAYKSGHAAVLLADPGRPPFRTMAEKVERNLGGEYFDWHVNHPWNCSGVMLSLDVDLGEPE